MLLAIIAICVAIPLATVAMTASAYATLPDRVPLGLNYDGSMRGNGAPRPMIWTVVAIQIFLAVMMILAGFSVANQAPGAHGTLLELIFPATCALAITWRIQQQLLAAAQSQDNPSMTSLYVFIGAAIAISLGSAFLIPN